MISSDKRTFPEFLCSMIVCVNAERVKRQKSTGGEYQNVPFSYGTEESFRDGRKLEDAMESSEFNPPFPVPDNLHSHLVSAEAPFKLDGLLFGTLSEIHVYACIFDGLSVQAFCLDDMAHNMPVIFVAYSV